MGSKGTSRPGVFGGYHHYDSRGRKTGKSVPGLFGGYTHYDANGNKTGKSMPGMFGGYVHYDNRGRKTGSAYPGAFGSYHNYDARGKRTGRSDIGGFGSYHHNDGAGCYVATCVYGSYDCPEVWTLRRFRDDTLAASWAGRAFIRCYYAVSPGLVRRFGAFGWFRNAWKPWLDRLVRNLQEKGVESAPYQDKTW